MCGITISNPAFAPERWQSWSIALVLKTSIVCAIEGSNPSLSVIIFVILRTTLFIYSDNPIGIIFHISEFFRFL